MIKNYLVAMMLFFGASQIIAQQQIKGSVSDDTGPIPGVSVVVKGTTTGTTTDFDGNFSIEANDGDVLIFSYVGYEPQESIVSGTIMDITLQSGVSLDEVVLVGNRAKPRTILDSPVPIDNIGVAELKNTGQPTVDKMLTYKVPSFNSTTQAISDGTAHFDPADLRGLGPSRTLVLVNGKRKNQSALVYINDTPGKGEVGVDLKSIPAAAIERIEVLRDGASAQYGSDAIAGVINMVLKKDVEFTTVSAKAGVTTEGDGFNFGADLNTSLNLGKEGSYLNFTLGYYQQEETNRAGTPGKDDLFGVAADDPTFGDWLAENPDLGMTVGQPELKIMDVFVNAGVPIGDKGAEFYTFGGLTYRTGKSFALYRTPYWVQDPYNLLHEAGTEYQGFQPTFETDIRDNNMTAGFKWDWFGFKVDLSGTFGRNAVDYEVNNTLNVDLGANSPTSFKVGGYTFSNTLANLDLSRELGAFVVSFGAEVRGERFTTKSGEFASYYNPTGSGGAQSFPGLQPSNAVSATRDNYGVYGALDWEPTEKILIGGAVRYEDFSDFGDNTSWKINGRYSLGDKGAIRASYSTGFRAPSLHQIYLSNVQTLVSGGTISNQGTFNNVDPIIRDGLGVPQLTAETSKNISAGITFKPVSDLSLTLDFYNVKVDNRVLFTNEIGFDGDSGTTNPVEQILMDNSITSLKFFVNAVNTNTTGVDLVANYRNIELGSGKLGATLAANFNNTDIDGKIDTPTLLEDNGYDIFNRKEQSRILSARPKTKVLLGFDYEINKWNLALNNTYFGEVTWQHATDEDKDQTFAGKVITDVIFGYEFSDRLSASVSVSNLLDVYPDEIETGGDVVTDLGGRFKYPWEVNQFGTNGTTISGGLNFKF
ncbi:TonB-dependent receptor [Lacinutrix sp. C3R15]|uniref:TonB-dependent receptor n=1 Tax=Flavobacteriaceae TaxID=49546 RepID=UPI001C09EEE5|nr:MULTISPECIES: TonB-dependent receptor [Flavobacteriaceae]MBU2938325.1 TonB-dependent receptor [Lacinutrix sp. C3R15]MDO6621640.1 TonB-dependent receptor [Oceanihabitans sp. 1_MG-2023]